MTADTASQAGTADKQVAEPAATDQAAWRGIASEQVDEVSAPLAALLRDRSRRLLADLLRPHRRAVAWTAAAIVVGALARLAGPWLVGLAIDNGIPPVVKSGDPVPLLRISALFAATVAVQAVATRMFVTMTGRVGQSVVLELRRRLFWHALRLPVAFHESYTSGRMISRQTSDVEAISALFEEGLDALISAALTLVLVGTGMLLLDWQLGLVVLSGFIPLTLLSAWFRRESATAYRRIRETNALVIVHFVETFGGLRAVQAFRRERRNEEIFDALSGDYAKASRRASQLIAVFGPGISLVANVITRRGALLRRPAGDRRRHQGRRAGVVPALPAGVLRPPAGRLAVLQLVPGRRLGAGEDLRRPRGGAVGRRARRPGEPARRRRAAGSVRFDSVRFGYRKTVVLPGFDLDIPAGQTVALVGETGAGKTTVARLLARFYDPNAGRVLLDGVDLRDLPDQVLRHEVVLITQESFLFEGTVAENIGLGRPARHRRRGRGGRPGDRRARVHRRPAGRLRHQGRQARRQAVGRPAPADLLRQGVHRRPRRARARRGDGAARHPERAPGPGGPADRAGRPYRGDHRAPAVHRRDRRTASWCCGRARSSRTAPPPT